MKKLLIATDSHHPRSDGVSRFLNEIVPRLGKKFEVTVVAPKFQGDFEPVARTIRFDVTKMSIADYSPAKPKLKMIRALVAESDVIFTQTLGPIGLSVMHYSKKLNKPLISFIHSIEWELLSKTLDVREKLLSFLHTTTKYLAKVSYNKPDRLIVPSEDISTKLELCGIRTTKSIVSLGVNTKEFHPAQDKELAKKNIGIDKREIVIGYTGRLALEKDLITLYRAYKKLIRKYPNLTLLFVGNGSLKKRLIGEKIIVTGFVNDVPKYLQAMDIFVLPSLTETTSLSTLESLSCGVPVIATPVGHVRNYIQNGVNGFLFPFGDIEILSQKIEELINDDNLRRNFSLLGRKTVIKNYSWETCAADITKILYEVMSEKADNLND